MRNLCHLDDRSRGAFGRWDERESGRRQKFRSSKMSGLVNISARQRCWEQTKRLERLIQLVAKNSISRIEQRISGFNERFKLPRHAVGIPAADSPVKIKTTAKVAVVTNLRVNDNLLETIAAAC